MKGGRMEKEKPKFTKLIREYGVLDAICIRFPDAPLYISATGVVISSIALLIMIFKVVCR